MTTSRLLALFVALFLTAPALGQSVLNDYSLQADVWRPAKPIQHGVDAQGDLGLSIPVMTVPGRGIDFPIAFTYRSGVRVFQESGWVGLGWHFDPGSITRDVASMTTGTGGTCNLYNVDYTTIPTYQQDVYNVTTPGGSFSMGKYKSGTGTVEPARGTTGDFYALEWEPWKIEYGTATPVTVDGYDTGIDDGTSPFVDKTDYDEFTITAKDGTRYLFAAPTLSTFQGKNYSSSCDTYEYYVSTWRLIAILGPDYEGNAVPSKSSPGSWVKFEYTTAETSVSEFDGDMILQWSFLSKIITPTHRADFTIASRAAGIDVTPWQDFAPYQKLTTIVLYEDYGGTATRLQKVVLDQNESLHGGVGVERMGLEGIEFYGKDDPDTLPGYKFTYYGTQGTASATNHDAFGYFNTESLYDTDDVGDDAKSWSLASILHPTGGYETFEYENDVIDLEFDFSGPIPEDYTFNTWNESTSSGGTDSFTVDEGTQLQGGVRVTKTVRYAYSGGAAIDSTMYSYGHGRLSGVPPEWWLEELSTDDFFKPTNRGRAAVFYTTVHSAQADGTSTLTKYTTDLITGVERLQATLFRYNGVVASVVQGNQDINWGIAFETTTTANGRSTSEKGIDIGTASLAKLATHVNDVDIEWMYKNKVSYEETTHTVGKQWRTQNAATVTSRVDFTYDATTGLPTLIEESAEVAPDRTTDITYAYEIGSYSGMDALNMLTAVARRDVYEDLATDRYYRSSVTTYEEVTPSAKTFWKPYKTYEWINGTSAYSTSAPSFTDWTNSSAPSSSLWHNTTTFVAYDDNGRVLEQDDANGNTTEFFYGDNTTNCSNSPTTFNHAFLTCVERDNLQWKIDYDDGRVINLEDPNGDVAPRYAYDDHGRLTTISNAANQAVTQYTYYMSRVNQAGSYSASSPNYIQTVQNTGTTSYTTKEYLDAWGRSVQMHQQSGSDDFITAVDYDSGDRPNKIWKPFLKTSSGHVYQSSYALQATNAWDGSPEADAFGYPYTEKSYSFGQADSTLMPALSGGDRDYSRSRVMSERHRDLDYTLLTGRVRYVASADEEGLRVYSYIDGFGRELMHRRFAEHVTAPTVPADITLATSIFRAGGGALQGGGGEQDEKKKKDGGIEPPQELAVLDWDTDSDSYTPPGGTPPHLVTYVVTLTSSGSSAAIVNFEENSSFVGQYLYNSTHPTNVYTGSFVAYAGVTYDVEAQSGADPFLGGSASASIVMTIKVDGKLRVVMDTRYDRDVVDNPTTVYPPNYFFPPHGSANDWRTLYTYDTRGRMLTRDTPDGGTAQFAYDYQGNLRFSQDAEQATTPKTVSFTTYDSQNRPLVSGEAGYTSAFTSLNPNSAAGFESATGNWLTARFYGTSTTTKPSTGSVPWSIFSSQISSATIDNGKGRLTAEATLSGDGADEKWQLTLYSYDADGRIVKKTIHTESASAVATTIDVTLDRQGMPTWQHTTVGANNFYHWWEYDTRGSLDKTFVNTTNSKPGTADVEYDYNAAGLVSNVKYGGSFNSVPYAYNSRDWLKQIGNPSTTTYPFSAFYGYQNNGVIESTVYYNKQSPATFDQYKFDHTYDSMNRLLGADYSYYNSGWQASAAYDLTDLAYDPNGNLLTMKRYRSAGTLIDDLTYQYTAGTNKLDYTDDAVTTTGETWDAEDGDSGAFTYDANGSMTALPAPFSVTSAVYDVRGLVTKAVTGSGTTTYRYNSAGERYWKGGSDYYALDGAVQLGVFSTGGTLQYWNIIAGGRVVGRHESGNRKYYHMDHLGTTRAVVEGTCSGGCTIREARDYDAWGVEMAGRTYLSGNAAKEGFTSKERDSETGLDYFGARYYLQSIGRWNAVDPMAHLRAGLSPFNYVQNNPINRIDVRGALDDDYKLDKKTGEITLVKETDDEYDVLYAETEEGEIDRTKSIKVEQGILDSIVEGKTPDGTTYDYMSLGDDDQAKNIFEFTSSNSLVEWSLIQYGSESNYISTSGMPHSAPGGADLMYNLLVNKQSVRNFVHSHPTSTTGPSGFHPGHKQTGDRDFSEWVNTYFPRENIRLQIFEVKTKRYIEYNHDGIIGNQ